MSVTVVGGTFQFSLHPPSFYVAATVAGTFAVVSLMVGGAIESQMDFCDKLVGSMPTTTSSPNVTDTTTTLNNITGSTPAGEDVDPRLTACKMGLATTLTILVGASQVII